MSYIQKFICFLGLNILLYACKVEPQNPLKPEDHEELSGGQATVFDTSPNAFGHQVSGLTGNDKLLFFVGNSFFNQNWVSAPASTKARDGLGPFFNARSCASCHFKDGRGRPPAFSGETGHGLLIRLSIDNQGTPDPIYGNQLQDHAILGVMKEGGFDVIYTETSGTYPDGETYALRKPHYNFIDLAHGEMSSSVKVSPRVASQMIGLGLLEAVSKETILQYADEQDLNEDGISGKPNYVWDKKTQTKKIGRFGWKANQPSILQQTAAAFAGDIGITSFLFDQNQCPKGVDCSKIPNGGAPEIDDDDLMKVVLYSSNLAVPARRNVDDPEVLQGKQIFRKLGCSTCHIPKMKTDVHPTFSALSYQVIRPYTDLLLHDMGEELADNRSDGEANGREWRTPPLWGIGLFNVVNKHTYYLHDGRARNIEEAILWHAGEAESSKKKFKALRREERQKLIRFLNSL